MDSIDSISKIEQRDVLSKLLNGEKVSEKFLVSKSEIKKIGDKLKYSKDIKKDLTYIIDNYNTIDKKLVKILLEYVDELKEIRLDNKIETN